MACSQKTKCYSVIGVGCGFTTLGLVLIFVWPLIFDQILTSQLALREGSRGYDMWIETPIPMYLDLYLFNWTNAKEVQDSKWKLKPIMEELGPYVFSEHHKRVNLKWNDNHTITFQQIRNWTFHPELSQGSLDDQVTNVNVIAATVSYIMRHKHYLIKRAIDLIMKEKKETLFVTHTARELLFDGYDDKLLQLVKKLNISGIDIPFSKFGWFVERNESATYDGTFNMFTGSDDLNKLGMMNRWNGLERTPYYPGKCAEVVGTTGELWPPTRGQPIVHMFASDMCSSLSLDYEQKAELHGVEGARYSGLRRAFDNGSYYPEQSCFNVGDHTYTGLRNVSECRFGAPAFLSYPHFYLADENYKNAVENMNPNKSLHELYLELEPNTGIPLNVRARVQINIFIQPISGFSLYANTKPTFMPVLWFTQRATLTEDYASQVKMLLVLPNLGTYTGIGFGGIGIFILFIALILTINKSWKGNEGERLLPSNST